MIFKRKHLLMSLNLITFLIVIFAKYEIAERDWVAAKGGLDYFMQQICRLFMKNLDFLRLSH